VIIPHDLPLPEITPQITHRARAMLSAHRSAAMIAWRSISMISDHRCSATMIAARRRALGQRATFHLASAALF